MSSRRRVERKYFSKFRLGTAKKALKEVRKLKRILKPEPKHHTVGTTTITPNIAGSITHITGIANGNSVTTRVGNGIRASWYELRFRVTQAAAATETWLRCVLFVDKKQVESVVPATQDVLKNADVLSPYARLTHGRFRILFDRVLNFDDTLRQTATVLKRGRINMPIEWIGGAAGDISTNGIYLLFLSTLNANMPSVSFHMQIVFTDV